VIFPARVFDEEVGDSEDDIFKLYSAKSSACDAIPSMLFPLHHWHSTDYQKSTDREKFYIYINEAEYFEAVVGSSDSEEDGDAGGWWFSTLDLSRAFMTNQCQA
jgi:hypothetical protein